MPISHFQEHSQFCVGHMYFSTQNHFHNIVPEESKQLLPLKKRSTKEGVRCKSASIARTGKMLQDDEKQQLSKNDQHKEQVRQNMLLSLDQFSKNQQFKPNVSEPCQNSSQKILLQEEITSNSQFYWKQEGDNIILHMKPPPIIFPKCLRMYQEFLGSDKPQVLPEIQIQITDKHLTVGINQMEPVIDHEMQDQILISLSYHFFRDNELLIVLRKRNTQILWEYPFKKLFNFSQCNWFKRNEFLYNLKFKNQSYDNYSKANTKTQKKQTIEGSKMQTVSTITKEISIEKLFDLKFNIKEQIFDLKKKFKSVIEVQVFAYSIRVVFNENEDDFQEAQSKFGDLQPISEKIFSPVQLFGTLLSQKIKLEKAISNLNLTSEISFEVNDNGDPFVVLKAPEGLYCRMREDKDAIEHQFLSVLKQNYILFNESGCADNLEIYCFYQYLKKFKVIHHLLKDNESQESLNFNEEKFQISVELPPTIYDQVSVDLQDIVEGLTVKNVTIEVGVNLFDYYSKLSQKFESKFKVLISPKIERKVSYEVTKKRKQRTKREIVRFDVQYPEKIYSHQTINVDLTLIGDEEQVEKCSQQLCEYYTNQVYVSKQLDLHQTVYKRIQQKEITITRIEMKFKVKITQESERIVWIFGKTSNQRIEKAFLALQHLSDEIKEELEIIKAEKEKAYQKAKALQEKALAEKFQKSYDSIKIDKQSSKEIQQQLLKRQEEISQISTKFSVQITYDSEQILFAGKRDNIDLAKEQINILLITISQSFTSEDITNPLKIQAIEKIGIVILEKQYQVKIKKFKHSIANNATLNEQKNSRVSRFQIPTDNLSYQWAYKVSSSDSNFNYRADTINNFFNFDVNSNDQVENFYRYCCQTGTFGESKKIICYSGQMKIGQIYEIQGSSSDPNTWTEINIQTGKVRVLRRSQIEGMQRNNSLKRDTCTSLTRNIESLFKFTNEEIKEDKILVSKYKYRVEGYKENIKELSTELDSFCQTSSNYKELINVSEEFMQTHSNLFYEISHILSKEFNCSMKISDKCIEIQGFNARVSKERIQTLIDCVNRLAIPTTWVTNLQFYITSEKTVIYEVPSTCSEFEEVRFNFQRTLPASDILKVERLQNKKLWKTYQTEFENLSSEGYQPSEFWLYHGTRQTNPNQIYNSYEGFDIRFSNHGMWGQAVYFAAKASYSDNYAFFKGQELVRGKFRQVKQMFSARVMVGRFVELPQDNTLKMPPPIEGSAEIMYDSVKGRTNGSDVYMIYVNKKAYPEYLITYA